MLNSRRGFLGSVAVLTTAALAAHNTAFAFDSFDNRVELAWQSFVALQQCSGVNNAQFEKASQALPAGHLGKTTQAILLKNEKLVLVPTFIYWGANHQTAKDILVDVYNYGSYSAPIKTLNKFELGGILALSKISNGNNLTIKPFCEKYGNKTTILQIDTKVSKNKLKHSLREVAPANNNFIQHLFFTI